MSTLIIRRRMIMRTYTMSTIGMRTGLTTPLLLIQHHTAIGTNMQRSFTHTRIIPTHHRHDHEDE